MSTPARCLEDTAIAVWTVDLRRPPKDVAILARTLSSDERARAQAFRSQDHQRRYLVARGALRDVLGRTLGRPPGLIRFVYTQHGRPELARDRSTVDISFNVSHSHELALIGVTVGARIGVDVERVRPLTDLDALIARFFSAEEAADLSGLSPHDRLEAFFACWTRKEAYLKATGSGLTTPLDRFTVSVLPGQPPRIVHIDDDRIAARTWRLMDLAPSDGYRATLAVDRGSGYVVMNGWLPAPD